MLTNTNYFKMKTYIIFLIVSILCMGFADAHESPLIEKRKEFNFNYTSAGIEKLEITDRKVRFKVGVGIGVVFAAWITVVLINLTN